MLNRAVSEISPCLICSKSQFTAHYRLSYACSVESKKWSNFVHSSQPTVSCLIWAIHAKYIQSRIQCSFCSLLLHLVVTAIQMQRQRSQIVHQNTANTFEKLYFFTAPGSTKKTVGDETRASSLCNL